MTFHNEILSVLLRAIHAIFNRSPPELLHEIVLIDDGSTYENLGETLENYTKQKIFDGKIKIHRNEKREGLIRGRMIGARLATGDILVFLDSHMEVNFGWLHPLIEPIAINETYATVPHVEGIHHATYVPGHGGYGDRGKKDFKFFRENFY
jgi:polypeptide N-acetylgalactosaminyltransferase